VHQLSQKQLVLSGRRGSGTLLDLFFFAPGRKLQVSIVCGVVRFSPLSKKTPALFFSFFLSPVWDCDTLSYWPPSLRCLASSSLARARDASGLSSFSPMESTLCLPLCRRSSIKYGYGSVDSPFPAQTRKALFSPLQRSPRRAFFR